MISLRSGRKWRKTIALAFPFWKEESGLMEDEKDWGILYFSVHFLPQMPITAAATNTGMILGSWPEEKSCVSQCFHVKGNSDD